MYKYVVMQDLKHDNAIFLVIITSFSELIMSYNVKL